MPALQPRVFPEAKVAQPARELGGDLARDVAVALPADVLRVDELLARQDGDAAARG